MTDDSYDDVRDWWATSIIDMRPGEIRYRGYPIEELIGNASFAQVVWLLTRGELPGPEQGTLLDTALMSAVDHGPQAPSIAIARMAATCGVGLNNAMASAINVLGDVHGGAGEQAMVFYGSVADRLDGQTPLAEAVQQSYETLLRSGETFVPGFGHRFHPVDPRVPRLLALVDQYAAAGTISGRYAEIGRAIEHHLAARKGKPIPMNIDGATAVIYAELGFPPPLARGLFCISRSVGILAHAWEQRLQGGRNKGPIPRRLIWRYTGPGPRPVPVEPQSTPGETNRVR